MSPNFRAARPEEIAAVAPLMAHSFPGLGRSLPEWEAQLRDDPRGGVSTLWVGEEAGALVAACYLFRFRQWIGGERFPMMGLGGVAIAPTHRRRGLAARLLETGFRHSRERGDLVSALYPFRTGFYQRAGYGMAGEALQYQLPPDSLPDAPERAGVRLVAGEAERAAVRAVYDAWAPRQTGQLEREPHQWDRVFEGDRAGVLYRGPGGEPEGYVVFRYHSSLPRGARGVEVEEAVWLTPGARRGLHAWLSSLSDQWQYLVYRAHPDEGFAERLRELRYPVLEVARWNYWFPAAAQQLGPMFRLLDLPGALALRRVDPAVTLTLALEIRDEQVEENHGAWRLRLEGGRVAVERGEGPADLRLAMRIDTLSRLFVAALSPSAAVAAELATADRPDRLPELDRALHLPRPWTFDRF